MEVRHGSYTVSTGDERLILPSSKYKDAASDSHPAALGSDGTYQCRETPHNLHGGSSGEVISQGSSTVPSHSSLVPDKGMVHSFVSHQLHKPLPTRLNIKLIEEPSVKHIPTANMDFCANTSFQSKGSSSTTVGEPIVVNKTDSNVLLISEKKKPPGLCSPNKSQNSHEGDIKKLSSPNVKKLPIFNSKECHSVIVKTCDPSDNGKMKNMCLPVNGKNTSNFPTKTKQVSNGGNMMMTHKSSLATFKDSASPAKVVKQQEMHQPATDNDIPTARESDFSRLDPATPESQVIVKMVPAAELLGQDVACDVTCPVIGCNKVLPQPSALRIHLRKTHNINQMLEPTPANTKEMIFHYHCPEESCKYHLRPGSNRYFDCRKNLRQHYMKLHVEKKHVCSVCGRRFGLERDLRRHNKLCLPDYVCPTCKEAFLGLEAYTNHCKETSHVLRAPRGTTVEQDEFGSMNVTGNNATLGSAILKKASTELSPICKPNPQPLPGQILPTNTPAIRSRVNSSGPRPILPNPNIVILSMNMMGNNGPSSFIGVQPTLSMAPNQLVYIADCRDNSQQQKSVPRRILQKPCYDKGLPGNDAHVSGQNGLRSRSVQSQSTSTQIVEGQRSEYDCQTCKSRTQCDCPNNQQPALPCNSASEKYTAGTQTTSAKNQTVTGTQTAGDFILKKAMKSANIPIGKESRASQVSPRAKLKRAYQSDVQSSETQTTEIPKPLKRRRKRKVVQVQDSGTDTPPHRNSLSDFHSPILGTTLNIPDAPSWLIRADNETQTMASMALLDELQARIGESASTQTLDSFLLNCQDENLSRTSLVEDPSLSVGETGGQFSTQTIDQGNLAGLALETNQFLEASTVGNGVSSTLGPMSHVGDSLFGDQNLYLLAECSGLGNQDSHAQTQTTMGELGFPELLTSAVQTLDFDTTYMHIETQTAEHGENMFDQLLSNMQTQTTDDFLTDFAFTDIETQTTLPVDLVSPGGSIPDLDDSERHTIETQTSLQNYHQVAGSSTDMQTQTLLSQLELNPDFADSYTQTAFDELETFVKNLK